MHDYQDTAIVSESYACKVEGFPTLFEMDAPAQGADFFKINFLFGILSWKSSGLKHNSMLIRHPPWLRRSTADWRVYFFPKFSSTH